MIKVHKNTVKIVDCGLCRGTGKIKYPWLRFLSRKKLRICPWCNGSGYFVDTVDQCSI